jgi:F-type H+-transporting ATPase subunit delta
MIADELASRYSKALFGLGGSAEQLSARLAALEAMVNYFEGHGGFRQLLLAPHLPFEAQQQILKKIAELCQGDIEVVNFLKVLHRKGRLKSLPAIIESYSRKVKQFLGVVEALIITASPLDAATRAKLLSRLEVFYDKKLTVVESVDPRIIAGPILVVDRRMVDLSVKTRLAKLRDQLLAIQLT